ncbi:MAG: acyl-CoA dehydrogenase, partial [Pseudonocardiales bacterium]|nr:acyl-CoA dehydrogenase [Pseudonocardiales bacterium]
MTRLADAGSDARTLWRSLGEAGVLRSLPRESAHSLWVDPAALSELLGELDARCAPGAVLSVCVQVATVIPLLQNCAPVSPLAGLVLERMLRGETMVALAATDAGLSGSALLDLRTEVLDTADGVSVHGGKEWISNAGHCDEVLVLARCRPARHFTSYSWVL